MNVKQSIIEANQYFQNDVKLYLNFFSRYLQYGHKFFLERATAQYYKYNGKYPLNILDVGCGAGEGISYLNQRIPNARVIGIDPSESMLANFNNKLDSGVQTICTDLNDLIYTGNSFDLILSHSNFRFWANPINELKKAKQLLGPNGIFYLLDLRKDCCPFLLDEICKELDNEHERNFMRKQFAASYTLQDVKQIISSTTISEMYVFPGTPELYEDNAPDFFTNLNKNEFMAQSFLDLSKGFKNTKGSETIYHISLFNEI